MNPPFDPQLYFRDAIQAYQQGNLDGAEKKLREILRYFPKLDPVLNVLGVILLSKGKHKEAAKTLESAHKYNPKNVDVLVNLSSVQQKRGRLKEALKYIQKAESISPQRADISFNQANILLDLQEKDKARQSLEQAVKKDPTLAVARFNLGNLLVEAGDIQDAKMHFEKTLEIKPHHGPALVNLGNIRADAGDLEGAIALYQLAWEKNPAYLFAAVRLASSYIELGDFKAAEDLLTKSQEKGKNEPELFLHLGNACFQQNKLQEAERAYRKALELNPELEGALRNLRRINARQIPGWHFTMLADQARNDAYQAALEQEIKPDMHILDIGAGSGLLSMMAARAGASMVYACEMHLKLAKTAEDIIQSNGYAAQIKVFPQKSTQLKVGIDIPDKVDLIVSEILDVGLIGEGVMPTIRHATSNLLKPDGILIPARAKIIGQLIEIPHRHRINPIRNISGFDLSLFDQFRIPDEYIPVHINSEPHSPLSKPLVLKEVDFYQPGPAIQDDRPLRETISFEIIKSGNAQAVLFWFELWLTEDIKISSGPEGSLAHWKQALFCLKTDRPLKSGQKQTLQMIQSDQLIRFEW